MKISCRTRLYKAGKSGAAQVEAGVRRLGLYGGGLRVWGEPYPLSEPGLAHLLLDWTVHSFEIVGEIPGGGPHSIILSGI